MSEVKNKVKEEVKQGKAIKSIISDLDNDEMQELVIEDLGINKEIFEICPNFLDKLSDALGAIARGNDEQRNVGMNFVESMERIRVIKPGASLEIKDIYYNFKESMIKKIMDYDDSETKIGKFDFNLPTDKKLTKEEVKANIKEQMKEQNIEMSEKGIDHIINHIWDSYSEYVESKDNQEENSDV